MDHTNSQAQERPISGRITSAERSKQRERVPGEFLLSPGPSPEASEQSADSNDGRSGAERDKEKKSASDRSKTTRGGHMLHTSVKWKQLNISKMQKINSPIWGN